MARRKSKGSSKAGRPRKTGDRYPSGKLRPAGPNAVTAAKRKIGDAQAGEHPLDFALSRQWITERQHKDAMSYRAAFNLSHIGGPRLSCGSLAEAPPSEQLRINWSQMTDEEITDIFDRVFSGDIVPEDKPKLEAAALGRWKKLNAALTAPEREELFMVCVLGSWPFWMPKRAGGHMLGVKDMLKEQRLFEGLGAVARALRPPRATGTRITPVPYKRLRTNLSEEPVRYETPDGQQVQPEGQRGNAFSVSILRKRA